MSRPYGFLDPLNRLMEAYRRYEHAVWSLNAVIISIASYAIAEILGLPAFMNFYWEDYLPLAASPAILSVILGIAGATLIKRRKGHDPFLLLGPELSEKTKTAYDNRNAQSLPMQSLAEDLKASLEKIKPSQMLNRKQIGSRIIVAVLLSGITIFIAHSQISADITPADLQSLSDLKDKVFGLQESEEPTHESGTNLTGNIYGKPSLAVLNENKLELSLYPGVGAGSLSRKTEPKERAFQQSLAGEAAAVPSELYIESLPPENKEIIKRYFVQLSRLGSLLFL
ncbi:MAG: hypothetical protein GYA29_06200 [Methanothrix sp.]|nr:hypothetical protein [Methanothrix sp.]